VSFPLSRYKIIPCAVHEYYQLAVLKRLPLDLVWSDAAGEINRARLDPVDVYTKDRAEFLRGHSKGLGEVVIRLDHIREARWAFNGRLLGGD
jgi:transcriptional antiterminator Rof (Rho-off)